MSTLAIIAARWNSSRLPGKVLEHVGEWPALEHVVRRTQQAVQDVVVACPNTPKDARIVSYCTQKLRVPVFMWDGPESDVLGRYAACAAEHKASVVVRITADCPFLDPALVAGLVALQAYTGVDYVGCTETESDINGQDCEVFTRRVLDAADQWARPEMPIREHVGRAIGVACERTLHVQRQVFTPSTVRYRWTLDAPDDLTWLNMIAGRIDVTPPRTVTLDLLALLNAEPDLARYDS